MDSRFRGNGSFDTYCCQCNKGLANRRPPPAGKTCDLRRDLTNEMTTDQAGTIYADALAYLNQVRERVSDQRSFRIDPVIPIIERIIDHPGDLHPFFPLTMKNRPDEYYMVSHQVNAIFFALKIGISFDYHRDKLVELALCAVLHDIGIFVLDERILNTSQALTDEEFNLVRTHSETGRDLLAVHEEAYPFLPEVVYQHHERENGQGYPRGLRGNEIHEYAKIISIIDCYEAMINHRPHRKALMQSLSARELVVQSKQALFPPHIIKAFLSEITLYPTGSCVRLNNKLTCEVVATDRRHPFRPDVKVLFNIDGSPVAYEKMIRLRDHPHFFILEPVDPNALPERP